MCHLPRERHGATMSLARGTTLRSLTPAPIHLRRRDGCAMLTVWRQRSRMPLESGIVTISGQHSVDQTVKKLEELLQAKGVKIFTVIDHSGEAEKAGLRMPPTKVVIFGNPKAGTPLKLAAPSIAIDL